MERLEGYQLLCVLPQSGSQIIHTRYSTSPLTACQQLTNLPVQGAKNSRPRLCNLINGTMAGRVG